MVKPTYDNAPDAPTRNSPTTFRARMDAFLAWMPGFKTFVDDANTHIDSVADTVEADATAVEIARQQVVALEAAAGVHETNAGAAADAAALSAVAAGDASPIDLTSSNIGDLLQVVDIGGGVKGLAMSPQRLENAASFSGTTPTLNVAADQLHYGTLTGDTTFAFNISGLGATSDNVIFFAIEVAQGATPYEVTFPGSVKFDGGTPPSAPAANRRALYVFASRDAGTNWLAKQAGGDYA